MRHFVCLFLTVFLMGTTFNSTAAHTAALPAAKTTMTAYPPFRALIKRGTRALKFIRKGRRAYKVVDTVTGLYLTYQGAQNYANGYYQQYRENAYYADYYYGSSAGYHYAQKAKACYDAYLYYDWLARSFN